MKFDDVKRAIRGLVFGRKAEASAIAFSALVVAVATALGSPVLLGVSLLLALTLNLGRLIFRAVQEEQSSREYYEQHIAPWENAWRTPFVPADVLPLADWERELLETAALDTENAAESKG